VSWVQIPPSAYSLEITSWT